MGNPEEMSLANLCGGALMEMATGELRRISANIVDPNIRPTAKRKLHLEVIFEPDETRQMIKTTYTVKAVCPPVEPGKSVTYVAIDGAGDGPALFEQFTPQRLFDEKTELLKTKNA